MREMIQNVCDQHPLRNVSHHTVVKLCLISYLLSDHSNLAWEIKPRWCTNSVCECCNRNKCCYLYHVREEKYYNCSMAAGAEYAAPGFGLVVACYLAVNMCVWEYTRCAHGCASVYSCIPGWYTGPACPLPFLTVAPH